MVYGRFLVKRVSNAGGTEQVIKHNIVHRNSRLYFLLIGLFWSFIKYLAFVTLITSHWSNLKLSLKSIRSRSGVIFILIDLTPDAVSAVMTSSLQNVDLSNQNIRCVSIVTWQMAQQMLHWWHFIFSIWFIFGVELQKLNVLCVKRIWRCLFST